MEYCIAIIIGIFALGYLLGRNDGKRVGINLQMQQQTYETTPALKSKPDNPDIKAVQKQFRKELKPKEKGESEAGTLLLLIILGFICVLFFGLLLV